MGRAKFRVPFLIRHALFSVVGVWPSQDWMQPHAARPSGHRRCGRAKGGCVDDRQAGSIGDDRALPSVHRRISLDDWQRLSPAQRDAFAAHVLTGWTGDDSGSEAPRYTHDAAEVLRLLGDVALGGRITGLALEFAFLPDAWSVFVDVPVCRGLTVPEHTVDDTFCEAVVMALLRVYDVDFVVSDDDNAPGTPGERRAVNVLLQRVSHVLTDDLPDGWYDDLVRAFGRLHCPQDMDDYGLTMWMYDALARLRTTEIGPATDDRP